MKHVIIIPYKPVKTTVNYTEKETPLSSMVIRIRINNRLRQLIREISQVDKSVKPIPDNVTAFLIVDGLVYVEFSDGSIGRIPLTTFDNFRLARYLFNSPKMNNVPKWLTPGSV